MYLRLKFHAVLFLCVVFKHVSCESRKKVEARMDLLDHAPEAFYLGKLFLLSVFATIGFKFLLILPIFLSKIILLGVGNFISSSLHLLITVFPRLKKFYQKKFPHLSELDDYRYAVIDSLAAEPHRFPSKHEYLDQHVANTFETQEGIEPWRSSLNPVKSSNLVNPTFGEVKNRGDSSAGPGNNLKYKCVWVKEKVHERVYRSIRGAAKRRRRRANARVTSNLADSLTGEEGHAKYRCSFVPGPAAIYSLTPGGF